MPRSLRLSVLALGLAPVLASCGFAEPGPAPTPAWAAEEAGALRGHVQITFPDRFVRAGEAYFDAAGRWIVFQAVPVPEAGEETSPNYAMYVAKLVRDGADRVTGAEAPIRISPEGSANTCGFFHPEHPWRLIFGSTVKPPTERSKSGYQRGQSRYVWQFPPEMEVCSRSVPEVHADVTPPGGPAVSWGEDATVPVPLWTRHGYDAECAFSPDGRFIVHTQVDPETGDGDLFIFDTRTKQSRPIVQAKGYDGGPFFSADGRRICYRSDRAGNDLLQVYVADLKFDDAGVPVGVEREHPITADEHVNWAPYFHPSGGFVVFTTSREGHDNYEVFSAEVPAAGEGSAGALKFRRITHAPGFDGMPVFSGDGKLMMWTSQRGAKLPSEQRPSSQVWIAEVVNAAP